METLNQEELEKMRQEQTRNKPQKVEIEKEIQQEESYQEEPQQENPQQEIEEPQDDSSDEDDEEDDEEQYLENAGEEVGFRLPKKIIRSSDIIQAAGKKTKKAKRYVRIGDESKEGTGETLLITNFEVEEQQNAIEVRNGVKIYGTGIRGLRTLRENRDDDDEEEKDAETLKREYIELKGDKFKRFQ